MAVNKGYHRRNVGAYHRGKSHAPRKIHYNTPRIDPQLKQVFKNIGVPKPTPFRPDPFQTEALDKLKEGDVLVSAPTGSGKTWIATQAVSICLSQGKTAWYASPLKALSNAIYLEFRKQFGYERVGILTGDRKENPDAPIIVGTTEILRNQLYDAMHEGRDIKAHLVVLDEAHYLSDPDRGVVWEEVLIYLPSRVRLLLLSATISNGEEICSWLGENRSEPAQVVRTEDRPVPLETLFLFPDGLVSPLGGKRGLSPRVKKFLVTSEGRNRRRGSRRPNYRDLITCLRALDLLPAIFFLKSRSDCDQAVLSCGAIHTKDGTRTKLRREVKAFIKKYPHLEGHRQLESLLNARVGAHHAGQLPYWKILIETMMNRGYLEAIFSTSTVAAGVNFPARTVALVQSDRFNGYEFSDLTATELHQMTGRAGRRGKDNIGFVLVLPGLYQDPQLIHELKDSPPEPLMSQIHINFSMTLNLLLSHRPEEVKVLLERSFAAFQERHVGKAVHATWERLVNRLKTILPQGRCDTGDPYVVMENIQKYDQFSKKIRRMSKTSRQRDRVNILRPYLKPGRLFLHKNGHDYVIFRSYPEGERLVCIASDVQKLSRDRKKRIKTKRVDCRQIAALYNRQVDIPDDVPTETLVTRLKNIPLNELEIIQPDQEKNLGNTEYADEARRELGQLSCAGCPEIRHCHRAKKGELDSLLKQFQSLSVQIEGTGAALWVSFKRHLRFLKDTGFVDEKDELTADGHWASQLRLDHPLLIAEAIRKGSFEGMSPEVMAGCIAPFVWDRDQEMVIKIQGPVNLKPVESAFQRILESIEDVRHFKAERGFENPPIPIWPAGALYLWAKGVPWQQLVYFVPVAEGDMASLIVRTADHLRQVSNLGETHPGITAIAREAMTLIQREPVVID